MHGTTPLIYRLYFKQIGTLHIDSSLQILIGQNHGRYNPVIFVTLSETAVQYNGFELALNTNTTGVKMMDAIV